MEAWAVRCSCGCVAAARIDDRIDLRTWRRKLRRASGKGNRTKRYSVGADDPGTRRIDSGRTTLCRERFRTDAPCCGSGNADDCCLGLLGFAALATLDYEPPRSPES